jgi:SAM-dependent methyltransferase
VRAEDHDRLEGPVDGAEPVRSERRNLHRFTRFDGELTVAEDEANVAAQGRRHRRLPQRQETLPGSGGVGKVGGMAMSEAQQVWEEHYGQREQMWSGRVNVRLAEVVEPMAPGRALDLGCGEGGDAVWLAEHGWKVTAVDISQTALDRAAAFARSRNMADRIVFQRRDMLKTFPDGVFDLVSAQFLHSKLPMDRARLLRRAVDAVAPDGTLLIVDHAAPPPGMSKQDHHHEFPGTDEVVSSLNLDDSQWDRVRIDAVDRDATGPDGERFVWTDNVMVLRRR